MPSLTFKCKAAKDENKLEVTILSCEGLPDLDDAFNLTDPYVVVKVGNVNAALYLCGIILVISCEKCE